MNRRLLGLGLALLAACPVLPGCELLPRDARAKSGPALADDDEAPKPGEVKSEPPKGFFANSRLSGALSSEGRDVERHLGVQ